MKNSTASVTMFGAVSIVNAIATGKGCTFGISHKVKLKISLEPGHQGISRNFVNDKLVNKIIRSILPAGILKNHFISINLVSEIPAGWGLKSSSAVSNAISLACYKLLGDQIYDRAVLHTAVNSCLWAKVSITGAYDDACACYYGGVILTDNHYKKIIKRDMINNDLVVVLYLPAGVARGEVPNLRIHKDLFNHAFRLALKGDYWKAMNLNGVLINSVLYNNYAPMINAFENHCLGISHSGNGPAIAAVFYKDNVENFVNSMEKFDGKIITAKVNNTKAIVE